MSFNSEMTSLADAIRAKSGVSGKLTIAGMTNAVEGIELGGAFNLVKVTKYSASPFVLKGVLATGYENGEWSFESSEQNFTGFSEPPLVDCVYAVNSDVLIGAAIEYIDVFPGNSALFAIDASTGTADLISGGTPSTIGSGAVLQNGEFCFDGERAFDYPIGNTLSALQDFTIEMDYTITSSDTGYCGFFGNRSQWTTDCICMQWGRDGYRPSIHWNGFADGLTGGSSREDWVNDGKYHHVAFVRQATNLLLFSDGIQIAFADDVSDEELNLAVENILAIRTQHVENKIFPGRMKHFRILPFARYNSNFKPANWVGK
jgi:hypothetical protein